MIYEGSADPHEVAESWHRGDLETALSCLVERLQQLIRAALVPELTNRFTEESGPLPDNRKGTQSPEALFARLAIAENLRDQFGRGINMELALKVLLLGLAPPSQRSTT